MLSMCFEDLNNGFRSLPKLEVYEPSLDEELKDEVEDGAGC